MSHTDSLVEAALEDKCVTKFAIMLQPRLAKMEQLVLVTKSQLTLK